jgi:MerR family transcriptional regulator, copper efflux regulator
MQISEFSRATGLSPDTVRFYVRRGLLAPETGTRGGSNPYQMFTREHVEIARLVRLAQSLGFTLREIGAMAAELGAAGLTRKRKIAILQERLDALDGKAAQLRDMAAYLRAKIAWLEGGEKGPQPVLPGGAVLPCPSDAREAESSRPARRRRSPAR